MLDKNCSAKSKTQQDVKNPSSIRSEQAWISKLNPKILRMTYPWFRLLLIWHKFYWIFDHSDQLLCINRADRFHKPIGTFRIVILFSRFFTFIQHLGWFSIFQYFLTPLNFKKLFRLLKIIILANIFVIILFVSFTSPNWWMKPPSHFFDWVSEGLCGQTNY